MITLGTGRGFVKVDSIVTCIPYVPHNNNKDDDDDDHWNDHSNRYSDLLGSFSRFPWTTTNKRLDWNVHTLFKYEKLDNKNWMIWQIQITFDALSSYVYMYNTDSPMTRYNNVTMISRFQSRSSRHQRSSNTIVSNSGGARNQRKHSNVIMQRFCVMR